MKKYLDRARVSKNDEFYTRLEDIEDELKHYDLSGRVVYCNCDAINVGTTKDIPKDYYGKMGVPITFMHKFDPSKFRIISFRKGDDGKDLKMSIQNFMRSSKKRAMYRSQYK